MNLDKKKIGIIVSMFIVAVSLFGGTYAYWTWSAADNTVISFTTGPGFACSGDGGGVIDASSIVIMPTSCTNSEHAVMKTITTTATITTTNVPVYMNVWLNIDALATELSQSQNFKYALTTSSTSCTTGVVASGTFNGKSSGGTVDLIVDKVYTATTTDTYYLYLWLDSAETDPDTADKSFQFSLGGTCGTEG